MPFTITAELPLGTYRGHTPDGSVESVPSVARLHAALLCAAGFGPRAVDGDDGLQPSDPDDAALRWLEENPPDEISVPPIQVNRGPAVAYREDGTLAPKKAGTNKLGKRAGTSVAVGGRFCWTWREDPPAEVTDALDALCVDVPHLGTAESPARLRTTGTPVPATHVLDRDAGLFSGPGDDVELPTVGRTAELRAAHGRTRSVPTPRRDGVRGAETATSPAPPRSAVRPSRYATAQRETGDGPWESVVLRPLDRTVPDRDKVRWAVAVHRALVWTLDESAPPLLTGVYPTGTPRPANRLSVQILDPGLLDGDPEHSAAAVLVPAGADPTDLAAVMAAVTTLPSVRGPRGQVARLRRGPTLPGNAFWPAPLPGTLRLWRTSPSAVPDSRGHGPEWGFTHAALLSLGHVWRDSGHLPPVSGRGAERAHRLVDAVNGAGAVVLDAVPLRTSRVGDHVHHVHPDTVVRPYEALLHVGALGGARTVQAVGQSRHLGGGLLVPVDVEPGSTPPRASGGRR